MKLHHYMVTYSYKSQKGSISHGRVFADEKLPLDTKDNIKNLEKRLEKSKNGKLLIITNIIELRG